MADETSWYHGVFMHTPTLNTLEVIENGLLEVDAQGTIKTLTRPESTEYASLLDKAKASTQFTALGANLVFIPGLVDLHVHAPQWPQLGKALHLPLQDWLQSNTFPLEARFQDIDYASRVYPSLVKNLLANGTTTAVYFSSIHEAATELLAQTCIAYGQRAFVGRVAMDDPDQCPEYYRDANTEASLNASKRSILAIRALPGNGRRLVQPIITPRFIPSCTNELLEGLGEMAANELCHIQTHCSESDWEHQYVLNRLGKTDTRALYDFNLLNRHTVLAHSNFITDADMDLISECGAGIAHCPLSNSYFADSVYPLRQTLNKSLHIGLGTDIAGGHSASLFTACRHAISASRMLETGVNSRIPATERGLPGSRINFIEAFYLATMGGSEVLDSATGCFEVGKQFDALAIQLDQSENLLNEFTDSNNWEELFSAMVYNVQPCNIHSVWIDGEKVKNSG